VTPALAGHWRFDEGGGGTVADSSGNSNAGSLQAGAAWAAGTVGPAAASLDGVDDYVQVGAAPALAMSSAMTVSAWVYPTGAGSLATYGGIIVNKEGEYEIARFTDGTIQWAFANSSPGWAWVNTGLVAPLNQWTHVVISYDNGLVKTYGNGLLVHTYGGAGVLGDVDGSQNDFRIGGRQCCSQNFQGRLDDVRVYNIPLSSSEVYAMAQDRSYTGTALAVPGSVEAEDFDQGGQGVGYYDTTPGTHGQDYTQPPNYPPPSFRQPTDVDIYKSAGYSGDYLIVMQAGDWMRYTVDVGSTGAYMIELPVYYWGSVGGTFHIEFDGVDKTGQMRIPGGAQFVMIRKPGVSLTAGRHVMRIVADTNAADGYIGDIDYVRFVPATPDAPQGLSGEYYDNIDFTNYKFTRVDPTVNFGWDQGSPDPSMGPDEFSVRWKGMVVPRYSETYTFYTSSDDGVRLWVNGQLVVDKWVDQAITEWSGQITLEAGRAYDIRFEYYERFWGAYATLMWSSPSQPKEVIPASQLFACWKTPDQFVRDFYQGALARQPLASELGEWTTRLAQAQTGEQFLSEARIFGNAVFTSTEYANRNRTNSEYVTDLYRAFLQREPDQGGLNWWTGEVANGGANGRANVREAFVQSSEFGEKLRRLCGAGATVSPTGGAGYDFTLPRLDPSNRTGTGGVDPLSRNSNWSIPLLNLPGRAGLDLGLTLSYNSLVWTKDAAGITFDADHGYPSPGFRLSFPSIQPRYYNAQTGKYAYLLLTPTGGRTELRQVNSSNVYESADSSYLQLTNNNGGGLSLVSADGTRLWFMPTGGGGYECREVKDRNGNFITVNYDQTGQIANIVDTLGRTVTFHYDAFQNLSYIDQPWTRETESNLTGAPETHVWATFGYTNLTLLPQFSGLAVIGTQPGAVIPALTQVGLDDGSYYKFSYNQWGQVWKVTHYAADSFVGGAAQDTHPLSYTRLDLPGSDLLAAVPQTDCPRFRQQREWIEGGVMDQSAELTTTYTPWSPAMASCDMAAPDGTLFRDYYVTSGWQKGQATLSEIWANGQRRKWTTIEFDHDGGVSAPYPTNPRVKRTTIEDAEHNRSIREVAAFAAYGLPAVIREYDSNGTSVKRRTEVDYKVDPSNDAAYLGQHLLGLVKERRVYDEAGALVEKMSFAYDQAGALTDQGAAAQHDPAYGASFATRGNVTAVQKWDVNFSTDASKIIERRTGYNTNGSAISEYVYERGAPAQDVTVIDYTDRFSDGASRNTYAYPTAVTDPDGFTRTTWYNYTFGAKTKYQTPQANATTYAPGPVALNFYDEGGRLRKTLNNANGTYTEWVYPASQTLVQSYTTLDDNSLPAANLALRDYNAAVLDGSGRMRASAKALPGGGFAARRFLRDNMGRLAFESNVTQTPALSGAWTTAGDDANGGAWRWTRHEYDWKGREVVTTNTDGSQRITDYVGCGCSGGDVITSRDEVGRRRRTSRDVFGRAWKTEDLNMDGSLYRTITASFNARDQVTSVVEQAAGGASQTTTTDYDGYGRIWKVKNPEADAPQVFEYYDKGYLKKVTDARSAWASYSYNKRGALTGIQYGAPSGSGIVVPDAVGIGYDVAGNRIWMTDGLGRVDYNYDPLSRLLSEARQFALLSNPVAGSGGKYTLSYQYTLSGELKSITDPTGIRVDYSYDTAGRVTGITGPAPYANVTQYATQFQYRSWGAVKSVKFGDQVTLTVGYNGRLAASGYDFRDASNVRAMGANYSYYDDGRLKFVDDLREDRFDRLYGYDQVGRVTKAETGYKARGAAYPGNNSQNGPYNHYYGYDEFDHQTSRTGAYWYKESGEVFSAQYVNNRNQTTGWLYDQDGRLTQSKVTNSTGTITQNYSYNAAGARADAGQYDGDGRLVKLPQGGKYHIRSTVLNGLIVSEVMGEGTIDSLRGKKESTYVYLGGEAIAEQTTFDFGPSPGSDRVKWMHRDPMSTSAQKYDPDQGPLGTANNVQLALDVQGIATEAPDYARLQQNQSSYSQSYSTYNYGSYGSYNPFAGLGGGMPGNYGSGCSVGGFAMSCSAVTEARPDGVLRTYAYHYDPVRGMVLSMTSAQIVQFNYNAPNGGSYQVTTLNGPPINASTSSVTGVWTMTSVSTTINGEAAGSAASEWEFTPDSSLGIGSSGSGELSNSVEQKQQQKGPDLEGQNRARELLQDCRIIAMLETIAWTEAGGNGDKKLDYNSIVYGRVLSSKTFPDLVGKTGTPQSPLTLPDLSKYPNIMVKYGRGKRDNSSAVGRYQFLRADFLRAWKKFGPVPDFGPDSQNLVAVEDMMIVGMIDPLLQGDAKTAIMKGNGEWSSLPGSPNGQGTVKLDKTLERYNQELANCQNSQKK
jgi:YD repeat-containing protein